MELKYNLRATKKWGLNQICSYPAGHECIDKHIHLSPFCFCFESIGLLTKLIKKSGFR